MKRKYKYFLSGFLFVIILVSLLATATASAPGLKVPGAYSAAMYEKWYCPGENEKAEYLAAQKDADVDYIVTCAILYQEKVEQWAEQHPEILPGDYDDTVIDTFQEFKAEASKEAIASGFIPSHVTTNVPLSQQQESDPAMRKKAYLYEQLELEKARRKENNQTFPSEERRKFLSALENEMK